MTNGGRDKVLQFCGEQQPVRFDGQVPLQGEVGKYYRPNSANFPVIDAYYLREDCLVALQMTRSTAHDIEGTAEQRAVLDALLSMAPGNKVAFVYIVPATLAGSFRLQPKLKAQYSSIGQYVMSMTVSKAV